ncbi:MAG: DUF523 domain-containing protein [Candidatus Puniceispirillum sp.]|nr:DUF523 domain-containing protein [Candidatus Puniceispirillum sp.]
MNILVSGCLLGHKVRYDGQDNFLDHPWIKELHAQGRLVTICPEVAGGLATPRPAAERQRNGRVLTKQGFDVTEAFADGAQKALMLARSVDARLAILKARSPSCGNQDIYDGTFTKRRVPGMGVTAELLCAHGVLIFNEEEIEEARRAYDQLTHALRK